MAFLQRRSLWKGNQLGFAKNDYVLVADAGSYALTGSSLTGVRTLIFNASGGTYTLTGIAATFVVTRGIRATAGSYTIGGVDANGVTTGVNSSTGTSWQFAIRVSNDLFLFISR